MPAPRIRTDHSALGQTARSFSRQADACQRMLRSIQRAMGTLQGGDWIGKGATAFYREMDSDVLPTLGRLVAALQTASQVTTQISQLMQEAEEAASRFFTLEDTGAAAGGISVALDPPVGVEAVTNPASASGGADTERRTEQERRAGRSERRADRRYRTDERWGRPAGGTRGGSHLDYDWAGGAILERYLTGGGDWTIRNDPKWTEYMQSSEVMTENLRERAIQTAQDLQRSGAAQQTINESFPMRMENGEGVVGYQYLHGTNANVGGFQRQGTATIQPDGQGGSIVTMNMTYTWNDVIDPNPQYATDRWKSTIAEIITLGQAEPYDIHISWTESTRVHLDASGNPVSISNQ